MTPDEFQALRDRMIRLEVIIGDDKRGLMAELASLREAVNDLKGFQLRVMGGFGVLAVVTQVALQHFLR
ncbi:MAG: hypothetical protein ACKOET_02290 [Verrucomicrobiota bacterium]